MTAKELVIAIKSLFDGKGTSEAQKQLDATGKKAGEASNKQGGFFQNLQGRVGKATAAIGTLRNLLTGFGAVGAIGAVVAQFQAIVENAKKATEEINKLVDEIGSLDSGRAVNRYAKAVSEAAEATASARKESAAWAQVTDRLTEAQRKAEDAASRLAEANEKASLDFNDPLHGERSAEISARYEIERAKTNKTRLAEDSAREYALVKAQALALGVDEKAARKAAEVASAQASGLRKQAELIREEGANATKKAPWYKGGWFGETEHDLEAERTAAEKSRGLRDRAVEFDKEAERYNKAVSDAANESKRIFRLLGALEVEKKAASMASEAEIVTAGADLSSATSNRIAAENRQRIEDLKKRAEAAAGKTEASSNAHRAEADAFSPRRSDYSNQADYNRDVRKDDRLESSAKSAERLNVEAQNILSILERTPIDKLATILGQVSSRLTAVERSVSNAEARSRRQ